MELAALSRYHALWQGVLYVALFFAGLFALGLMIMLARLFSRSRLRRDEAKGFSHEDLEALRSSGRLSEAEYSHLRRVVMGLGGKVGEKEDSALSVKGETDDVGNGMGERNLRADSGADTDEE